MLETQRKIRKQKPKLTTEELKSKHSRINNSLSLRTLLEHDRSAYKLILIIMYGLSMLLFQGNDE